MVKKKKEVELGNLLSKTECSRDAIHIAVIPVYSKQKLSPGQPVKLDKTVNSSDYYVVSCNHNESVGIVDPFLQKCVNPGEKFYLCLNPYSIISLKHEWEHPEFKKDKVNEEERYLENIAARLGFTLDDFIKDILLNDVCLSYDTPEWLYDEKPKIIETINKYKNINLNEDDFYFRCAC